MLLVLWVPIASPWSCVPRSTARTALCAQGNRKATIEELEARLEKRFKDMKEKEKLRRWDDDDDINEAVDSAPAPEKEKTFQTWGKNTMEAPSFFLRKPAPKKEVPEIAVPKPQALKQVDAPKKKMKKDDKKKDDKGKKKKKKDPTEMKKKKIPTAVKTEEEDDGVKLSSLVSKGLDDDEDRRTLAEVLSESIEDDQFAERVSASVKEDFPGPATKIQRLGIPAMLDGRNLTLAAPTGSGKSLAFLLPAMALVDTYSRRQPEILVIAPTRDLAAQLAATAKTYAPSGVEVVALVGGANGKRQLENLKKLKPHVVVGTPGRLAECAFSSKALRLAHIKRCIVDEADEANKDVYLDDVANVLDHVLRSKAVMPPMFTGLPVEPSDLPMTTQPKKKSDLAIALSSATCEGLLSSEERTTPSILETIAMDCRIRGREFAVQDESSFGALASTRRVAHGRLIAKTEFEALDILRRVLRATDPAVVAAIVFVESPDAAQDLVKTLKERSNIPALPLTGREAPITRAETLRKLRVGGGKKKQDPVVVVATEVAARGLDAPAVTHVINFLNLPSSPGHYAHRAGRTGRGPVSTGFVLTIARPRDTRLLQKLQHDLGITIHTVEPRFGDLRILSDVPSSSSSSSSSEVPTTDPDT